MSKRNKPTVLVFCPVYDRESEDGTGQHKSVQELMSDDCRRFLYEICADDDRCEVLVQNKNPFSKNDVEDTRLRNVLNHHHQYREARDVFLHGNWTHVLFVESDMSPHDDTLDMLLACDADAAFAPYMLRHGFNVSNIMRSYGRDARNQGESIDHGKYYRTLLRQGDICDCTGCGFGVTLYRREVMRRISMRLHKNKMSVFCDHWFNKDIFTSRVFSMRANLRAVAGHQVSEDVVLYPAWADQLNEDKK